jgi:uncharacterized membrane protein
MVFWIAIGTVVGAVLGGLAGGAGPAVALAFVGGLVGLLIARLPGRRAVAPPPRAVYGERADDAVRAPLPAAAEAPSVRATTSTSAADGMPREAASLAGEVLARLERIEQRLAALEARTVAGASNAAAEPLRTEARTTLPDFAPPAAADATGPGEPTFVRAPDGTLEMAPPRSANVGAPPAEASATADATREVAERSLAIDAAFDEARPARAAEPREDVTKELPPSRPAYAGGVPRDAEPAMVAPLWRWIAGGNALTRIGVVILFFGVAFLLRYVAEIVTVPIEARLAAVAVGGLGLAALGVFLARRRPAYGLSLEGAGMGIVYLTIFAAFRLYEVMAPTPAIALLVVVATATIALALRHDSQPLAALAFAGGFLAPILIRAGPGSPAPLFAYFAVLNAAIVVLAWRRAWRPLNALGFVFTFALGVLWGWQFYIPAYFTTVEPFLALFFVFYVGIAILYARRSPLDAKAPVDALLVFGVPLVGFALQIAIVRGYRYGVAWSAGALAAFYAILWLVLRARAEPGLALLARTFAALAVVFATAAVPFALDPRWTSAWWALEAAAVYWLGVVQRQPLARAFAFALQILAGLVFAADNEPVGGTFLLNAHFLGTVLIGVAAYATVFAGDRHRDRIGRNEHALLGMLFVWGTVWSTLGGVEEMRVAFAYPGQIDAALAWVVVCGAVAIAAHRLLDWPRIAWLAALALPAMAVAAFVDLRATRTTLTHYGWLVWPIGWIVHWAALRVADSWLDDSPEGMRTLAREDLVRNAHALSAVALVAWGAWEASEWVGRHTREGSVWIACTVAALAIAYLGAIVRWREASSWPLARYGNAYGASAGTVVAAALEAWFAIVNFVSPGDPHPLTYWPIANPLDLTLIAALGALYLWMRVWGRGDERTRLGVLGAGAFIAINGTVVRTAHHWGDVGWVWADLIAYRPLQAALTLTWSVTAVALMLWATRRRVRMAWMTGVGLLLIAVAKLFVVDLAALSGLTQVIAFLGVGALVLAIAYMAPMPPAIDERAARDGSAT